jgi:hypothetical protein
LTSPLPITPLGDVRNFLTVFEVAPDGSHGLIVHAHPVGDGAVGLFGVCLEAAGQNLTFLFRRQLAAVKVEVLSQVTLLRLREVTHDLQGNVPQFQAQLGGDLQTVGAVDDVVVLVNDDRHNNAALLDVVAQGGAFLRLQRRQRVRERAGEGAVPKGDGLLAHEILD